MRIRDRLTGSGLPSESTAKHPQVLDSILAVGVAVLTTVLVLNMADLTRPEAIELPTRWHHWLVLLLPTLAIPFRRLYPTSAMIGGGAAQALMWGFGITDSYLAMMVLIFSAAFYGKRRGEVAAAVGSILLTAYTGAGVIDGDAPTYAVLIVGLSGLAMTALGIGARNRLAYAEEVEARAIDLERSREVDQSRAIAEERNRIARELHDVVAHGLAVMVVQAAAGKRIIDKDPTGAKAALDQIEDTGRTALTEMRQVLDAVKTDPTDSWRPAPSLARVEELIDELSTAGLDVELRCAPAVPDDDPLPTTIDMTAYRIIQESLTNVLKHGGPRAKATVGITREPELLTLTIIDNGVGACAIDGGGHGLQGMRERVEVFGGSFRAQPRQLRGFEVIADLPLDGTAARTRPMPGDDETLQPVTDS